MGIRRSGMSKYMDSRSSAYFKIQITSMVDMFVILLVFLLKSFSTSAVQVTPSKDLNLPVSEATTDPIDVLKMVVSKQGVFVEDQRVLEFTAGDVTPKDIDQNDAQFIRPLYEALDKTAQKTRDIAAVNETVEFDGKIFIQADKDLPYSVLQKVFYTMSMAGYADIKLAVIGK